MVDKKIIFTGQRFLKIFVAIFISCSNMDDVTFMNKEGYTVERDVGLNKSPSPKQQVSFFDRLNPFYWCCQPEVADENMEFEVPIAVRDNGTLGDIYEKEEGGSAPKKSHEVGEKNTLHSTADTKNIGRCIFEKRTEENSQYEIPRGALTYKVRRDPFDRNLFDFEETFEETNVILTIGERRYEELAKKIFSSFFEQNEKTKLTGFFADILCFSKKNSLDLEESGRSIKSELCTEKILDYVRNSFSPKKNYHIMYSKIYPKPDQEILKPYRMATVAELFYIYLDLSCASKKNIFDREICTSDSVIIEGQNMYITVSFSKESRCLLLNIIKHRNIKSSKYMRIAVQELGLNFSEPSLFYICDTPVFCCNNLCVKPRYMCHCCYCPPYSSCCKNSTQLCGNYTNMDISNVLCCYMPAIDGCCISTYTTSE